MDDASENKKQPNKASNVGEPADEIQQTITAGVLKEHPSLHSSTMSPIRPVTAKPIKETEFEKSVKRKKVNDRYGKPGKSAVSKDYKKRNNNLEGTSNEIHKAIAVGFIKEESSIHTDTISSIKPTTIRPMKEIEFEKNVKSKKVNDKYGKSGMSAVSKEYKKKTNNLEEPSNEIQQSIKEHPTVRISLTSLTKPMKDTEFHKTPKNKVNNKNGKSGKNATSQNHKLKNDQKGNSKKLNALAKKKLNLSKHTSLVYSVTTSPARSILSKMSQLEKDKMSQILLSMGFKTSEIERISDISKHSTLTKKQAASLDKTRSFKSKISALERLRTLSSKISPYKAKNISKPVSPKSQTAKNASKSAVSRRALPEIKKVISSDKMLIKLKKCISKTEKNTGNVKTTPVSKILSKNKNNYKGATDKRKKSGGGKGKSIKRGVDKIKSKDVDESTKTITDELIEQIEKEISFRGLLNLNKSLISETKSSKLMERLPKLKKPIEGQVGAEGDGKGDSILAYGISKSSAAGSGKLAVKAGTRSSFVSKGSNTSKTGSSSGAKAGITLNTILYCNILQLYYYLRNA